MVGLQSCFLILAILFLLVAVVCFVWFGVSYCWGLFTGATRPAGDYDALHAALVSLAWFGCLSVTWFLQEIPFFRTRQEQRGRGAEEQRSGEADE